MYGICCKSVLSPEELCLGPSGIHMDHAADWDSIQEAVWIMVREVTSTSEYQFLLFHCKPVWISVYEISTGTSLTNEQLVWRPFPKFIQLFIIYAPNSYLNWNVSELDLTKPT